MTALVLPLRYKKRISSAAGAAMSSLGLLNSLRRFSPTKVAADPASHRQTNPAARVRIQLHINTITTGILRSRCTKEMSSMRYCTPCLVLGLLLWLSPCRAQDKPFPPGEAPKHMTLPEG